MGEIINVCISEKFLKILWKIYDLICFIVGFVIVTLCLLIIAFDWGHIDINKYSKTRTHYCFGDCLKKD